MPPEKRRPPAGIADGASDSVHAVLLNNSESTTRACRNQRLEDLTAAITAELRQQRAASHLHSLGPRPLLEALRQVADGGSIDVVLSEYQRLDPATVRAIGADDFPQIPIHEVPR